MRKFTRAEGASNFQNQEFSPRDKSRILDQYEKQLDLFINTCLIYNIKPILTTDYFVAEVVKENLIKKGIFNSEEVTFYLEKLIPELNSLIVIKAEKYEIPVIQLHKLVEKNEKFVNKEDGVHLTNIGSENVSEVISSYLISKIQHEEI